MKTKEQLEAELNAIAERLGPEGDEWVLTGMVMYGQFTHSGARRADVVASMVEAKGNPGITVDDMNVLADAVEFLRSTDESLTMTRIGGVRH